MSNELAERERIQTMADWERLSSEQQQQIIEALQMRPDRFPAIRASRPARIEDLTDADWREFAAQMEREVGDIEVEDDGLDRVGAPRIQVRVFTLPSGEIIGGRIDYFQAAPGDVGWEAHAYFNHLLEPLGELPYVMERHPHPQGS
jgi:hypothetical protein